MGIFGVAVVQVPLFKQIEELHEDIDHHVSKLESYRDQLELIQLDPSLTQSITVSGGLQVIDPKKVFVVHGHDNESKLAVARFLEKLELKPIILHEQADLGLTVIEKFEANSNVGFAVVLITPDDVGTSEKDFREKGEGALRGRARQNVVFELGFFMAKLGRTKVRALVKGEVDIHSDIQGVIYTPIDPHDGWKFKLAKEMQDSGMDIDLTKAF